LQWSVYDIIIVGEQKAHINKLMRS